MLKYYSYYNVGGYKDMFLGDSSMNEDKTYFLPLLNIWKKKAQAGDKEMASRLQSLETLPMIKLVTGDDNCDLPESAKILFSHGGYKIILTTSESGETIFAIRDVESSSKDESGRTIPFLLVIVGSSDTEKNTLEKFAAYASSHLDSFSQKISGLFSYDSTKNGISFELATLTAYVDKISQKSTNSLLTMRGEVVIGGRIDVPLMIVPEGLSSTIAIQEQGLSGKKVNIVNLLDVVPLDNHEKLVAIIKRCGLQKKTSIFSDKKTLYFLAGATLIGFVLGYIMAK